MSTVKVCEFKDLNREELYEKSLEELKGCGCDRCASVFAEKDYARLQRFEQEQKEKELADQMGEEWAKTVLKYAKQHQKSLEERAVERMMKRLNDAGIDLNTLAKAPFWNTIQRKGVGVPMPDGSRKNFYINTGVNQQEEFETALKEFLATGNDAMLKDLSAGVGPAGGYTVDTRLASQIIEMRDQASGVIRAGARVEQADGKIELPVQVGRTAGAWQSENTEITGTVEPVFGQVTLDPEIWSAIVPLSIKLLRQTAFDLFGFLARDLGRAAGKEADMAFINGDGNGQPLGILYAAENDPDMGIIREQVSSAEGTLTADELIDIFYALEQEYQENAVWLMNQHTARLVRKLKDSNGRYLWDFAGDNSGITRGTPGQLLGRPVIVTNNMPHDTENGDSLIFGDFSYYYIAQNGQFEVSRDGGGEFFRKNQVGVKGLQLLDGAPAYGAAFAVLHGIRDGESGVVG